MKDKKNRLIDAIGEVRDEYIEDAHGISSKEEGEVLRADKSKRSRRRLWYSVGSLAVMLVLFIGIGSASGWFDGSLGNGMDVEEAEKGEAVSEETAAVTEAPEMEYESSASEAAEVSDGYTGTAESAYEADEESVKEESTVAEEEAVEIEWDPGDVEVIEEKPTGEAFVLTAGRWKDNDNWPFFVNLVNSGTISFPAYGIDPRNRVKVQVLDVEGNPLRNEEVMLVDGEDNAIWRARSDKDGIAYLFAGQGTDPAAVYVAGQRQELYAEEVVDDADDQQGSPVSVLRDEITVTLEESSAEAQNGLQVMFIVDTTGSMGDEIAYLQKDFSSIAESIGSDGVEYSVNFYRDEGDEYVVRTDSFTDEVERVSELLAAEYATGGGDEPEAVADALYETITANDEWRSDKKKIAFLIFDAPPHYGTEGTVEEAVREAAARGIVLVPVVASNSARETELFGRALAICTNGTYVFLTDDSGVGGPHLEPIIGDYNVELLHDIIVDLIREQM